MPVTLYLQPEERLPTATGLPEIWFVLAGYGTWEGAVQAVHLV